MTDRSLAGLLRRAPGYAVERLYRWGVHHYLAFRFRRATDHPALSREAAAAAVRGADRLLFLCWGNVCRSPFAERRLRQRLAERGVDGPTVDSAGLGRREGRPSPAAAVDTAEGYGVSLADHRSTLADRRTVGDSVLLVMDYNNYHSAVTRFPEAAGRTFFLSAFNDAAPVLIPDPFGGGPDRFAEVYDATARAVEGIVSALEEGDDRPG